MFATLNLALRFVLELAGIVALAWWGFHAMEGPAAGLLGIGAPVALIVVWSLFVAPRARYPQAAPVRLVAGTATLEATAAALALAGATTAAITLAALVGINAVALALTGAASEDLR